MLSKWVYVGFLVLAIRKTTANFDYIDVSQYNTVYYDPITKMGLKGQLEDSGRWPLSNARISFRGMRCDCENLTCSCCSGVNITLFNFDRRTCTTFTYDPDDFAIKVAIMLNEKTVYTNSLSAKNPPPLCVPLAYLPILNFCVRFFDVYTPGRNLHSCIDFETRIVSWPILILHFNCIKIGVDGVTWTKPENGGDVLQMKPETSEPEVYDEVNFEQDSELPSNQTTNLTPEEEDNIGQLKL